MPTIRKAKAKQAKRTRRSQLQDARTTAKRTVSQSNKSGIKSWMKRPGKLDISGVDTYGRGVNVSIRPSRAK